MKKALLSAAALISMTGFAMANEVPPIVAGISHDTMTASEMATTTGTAVGLVNVLTDVFALNNQAQSNNAGALIGAASVTATQSQE